MMSGHVLHAGEGYAYLMRSVATADERSSVKTGLFDYYESHGTPPGRWFGSGLASLNSETVVAGTVVSEENMAALFGEGLHPDADAMIESGASLNDVQLGRAFPMYTGNDPVVAKLATAEKSAREAKGSPLTLDERTEVAVSAVRDDYKADTGEHNPHPKDVAAWANQRKQSVKQATSGFDFTFSPPKSVSMLWALGDNDTRRAIEAIHHDSVNHTLEWFEDNALYTRDSTPGGKGLVPTSGMLAAQFDHFDTRAGDPDLHTHVAVSNKVYDPAAGKWKSIEGRTALRHVVTASARYNTHLIDQISERLGVAVTAREMGESKRPVHEIAGIPQSLIDAGSKRREQVTAATEKLVSDYFDKHGHAPSQKVMHSLAQQATLETRPDKGEAKSLAQLRGDWRSEFAGVVGGREALDDIIGNVLDNETAQQSTDCRISLPAVTDEHYPDALDAIADEAVGVAAQRRSHFAERHLDSAVSDVIRGYRTPDTMTVDELHDAVMIRATQRSVSLSPRDVWDLPDALTHLNGQAIDRNPGDTYFTSPKVMAMEDTIVDSATTVVPFTAAEASIQSAIERYNAASEFDVNDGQAAMIRHLAATGTQTAAAVGPAGTGKTTSMKVLADIWNTEGHQVVALSTQRTAAKGLANEIGSTGYTLDSLARAWRGEFDGKPAGELSSLPVELNAGDMLLVDEAGMGSTDNLAAITEIAGESGAVVRMIGDPAQLSAVERGGVFDHLCKATAAPELDTVVRMGADTEQAENTLLIRHGDARGLDMYFDRGWVRDGSRGDMLDAAVADHLSDRAAGMHGLLIAPTNDDVSAANQRIRDALIDAGAVTHTDNAARLTDGSASCGDTILARKNTRYTDPSTGTRVEVSNGDMFRLDSVGPDGSVMARHLDGKGHAGDAVVLPSDYLAGHCQLGYAATVHRSQGVTVSSTRALTDAFQSREMLYVALTRGAKQNHLYVATDDKRTPAQLADIVDSDGAELHMAGERATPDARSLLERVLNNSSAPESASALRERLAAAEFDPGRADGLYRVAANKLTASWATQAVSDAVDHLPGAIANEIDADGQQRIATALVSVSTSGADAEAALRAATDLDGSERDTVAVVTHRLSTHRADTAEGHSPVLPPRWVGEDTQLRIFAEDTALQISGIPAGPVDEIGELNRQYAEHWVDLFADRLDGVELTDPERATITDAVAAATRSGGQVEEYATALPIAVGTWAADGLSAAELALSRLEAATIPHGTDSIPAQAAGQDSELRRKVADELGLDLDTDGNVDDDPLGLNHPGFGSSTATGYDHSDNPGVYHSPEQGRGFEI